jgi:hypothetical protein
MLYSIYVRRPNSLLMEPTTCTCSWMDGCTFPFNTPCTLTMHRGRSVSPFNRTVEADRRDCVTLCSHCVPDDHPSHGSGVCASGAVVKIGNSNQFVILSSSETDGTRPSFSTTVASALLVPVVPTHMRARHAEAGHARPSTVQSSLWLRRCWVRSLQTSRWRFRGAMDDSVDIEVCKPHETMATLFEDTDRDKKNKSHIH